MAERDNSKGAGERRVREQKPPDESPRPRSEARPRSRRDKFAQLEARLTELIAGLGVAQAGLSLGGDDRHQLGGQVTADFAPQLAGAWVALARENANVEKVLVRMLEGSAMGQAVIVSLAFAYSQAQVYGALPPSLPNPWVDLPVPPSPEVARHEAARAAAASAAQEVADVGEPPPAAPEQPPPPQGPQAKPPPKSEADMSAMERAEAERAELERRRRQQGRGA